MENTFNLYKYGLCVFVVIAVLTLWCPKVVRAHDIVPHKEIVHWNFSSYRQESVVRKVVYHRQFVDLVIGNPGHVTRLKIDFDCTDTIVLFAIPEDSSRTWSEDPDTVIVYFGNTLVRLSYTINPSLHDTKSFDPYEGHLCFGRHSDLWRHWTRVTFSPYMLVLGEYDHSLARLKYDFFELIFRQNNPVIATIRGHRYKLLFDLGNEYTYVPRQLYHHLNQMDIVINNIHMDVDFDDISIKLINGFDRSLVKKNKNHSDTSITLGRYFGHNFAIFYDGITHTQRIVPSFHFFNTGVAEPFYSNFGLSLFTVMFIVWLSYSLVRKTPAPEGDDEDYDDNDNPFTSSKFKPVLPVKSSSPPPYDTRSTTSSSSSPSPYDTKPKSSSSSTPLEMMKKKTSSFQSERTERNGEKSKKQTARRNPIMIGSIRNDNIISPKSSSVIAVTNTDGTAKSTPQTPSIVSPQVVSFLEFYGYMTAFLLMFADIHGMVGSRNFSYLLSTSSNVYYVAFHSFLGFNIAAGTFVAAMWPFTFHHMGIRRVFFETTVIMGIFLFSTYKHDSYSILFVMLILVALYTNFRILQFTVCFLKGPRLNVAAMLVNLFYSAAGLAFFHFYTVVPITNYFFSDFSDIFSRISLLMIIFIGIPSLVLLSMTLSPIINSTEDVIDRAMAAHAATATHQETERRYSEDLFPGR